MPSGGSPEITWSPWHPAAGILAIHGAHPEPGPAVRVPRGAHGRFAAEFLDLCAQRELTIEACSCRIRRGPSEAPTYDTLSGPRRATWAARGESQLNPAT